MRRKNPHLFSFVWTAFFLLIIFSTSAYASKEELQTKISEKGSEIDILEKEIAGYQEQLTSIGAEKQTLQSAIKTLDITVKKLSADIQLTQKKITVTERTIEELASNISAKSEQIEQNKDALADSVQLMREIDDTSLLEIILANERLSDVWNTVESIRQFQSGVNQHVTVLKVLKKDFEDTKTTQEAERKKLLSLKNTLSDQKIIVDQNRREKDILLKETKNKESNYTALINEKIAKREALERELAEYESALRIEIDPTSIPKAGKGVLAWPLKSIKITQYFGNTEFAKSGAYNGQGHNGIDFRASVGTEVFSAGNGIVTATGNTDTIKGCYSYGKWVLIRHNTGLSTLYAHFSLIKVSPGQEVSTGELIGYSGATGYATGPHLHFSVYATQGVQIVRLGDIKTVTNCANARIPVAPLNAYLDPIQYL
ncbi:MAG: peptidoglycan DD-metalloendopeptidase family protein [Parcubacteria group bacterium]|nr:peptidoglycan DD-metalloendopeptidase family protein [Parcubacteria group bacterium]